MSESLNFKEILSESFIASQANTSVVTILELFAILSISFVLGLFIFQIYKKTYNGVLYQESFNISLVVTTMVLSLVIMVIKDNLVLSLGMVGALSIVRFRTPIKDPMDLVFIFWSIAIGIANGVGYFHISIIGSILIALSLLILMRFKGIDDNPYLLIIKFDKTVGFDEISDIVLKLVKNPKLKSQSINPGNSEIIYEIRLYKNSNFMNTLNSNKSIIDASLISYGGDIADEK